MISANAARNSGGKELGTYVRRRGSNQKRKTLIGRKIALKIQAE